MLRAALIGFAATGKTTLFQLMTSVRETSRAAQGKGEAAIGISKVPDARLDRLTAMYNPKKRVPATVEFSDLAAPGGTGVAKTLVDVVAYKNADALVHVLRAFEDPAVPHPSSSIDPARVFVGRSMDVPPTLTRPAPKETASTAVSNRTLVFAPLGTLSHR